MGWGSKFYTNHEVWEHTPTRGVEYTPTEEGEYTPTMGDVHQPGVGCTPTTRMERTPGDAVHASACVLVLD